MCVCVCVGICRCVCVGICRYVCVSVSLTSSQILSVYFKCVVSFWGQQLLVLKLLLLHFPNVDSNIAVPQCDCRLLTSAASPLMRSSRLRWNITLLASAATPTSKKISGRSQESGSNYASIFLWSENVSEASEIVRHKKPRRPFFDVLTWNNFGSLDLRRQKKKRRSQVRP